MKKFFGLYLVPNGSIVFAIESPFNEWVISVFCDLNPLSLTCIKGSHVRLACHLRNKLLAKSQEREHVLLEWLKL